MPVDPRQEAAGPALLDRGMDLMLDIRKRGHEHRVSCPDLIAPCSSAPGATMCGVGGSRPEHDPAHGSRPPRGTVAGLSLLSMSRSSRCVTGSARTGCCRGCPSVRAERSRIPRHPPTRAGWLRAGRAQAVTRLEEGQILEQLKEVVAAQLVVELSAERFGFRRALTPKASMPTDSDRSMPSVAQKAAASSAICSRVRV